MNKLISIGIIALVFIFPFKYAYLANNTSQPMHGMVAFLLTLLGIFLSMFFYERGSAKQS